MSYIRKYLTLILAINSIFLSSVIIFYSPVNYTSINFETVSDGIPNQILLKPNNEGYYDADIHWVETYIELDKKGIGIVSILVNCTPSNAEHLGMYFRTIQSGEIVEVIDDQTFAIQNGQQLSVNHSATSEPNLSYRVYLENNSNILTNSTLQYHFTYNADFFLSEQIEYFKVDANLIVVDLIRPTWDADLDHQSLQIKLPIDVGEVNVSSEFLDSIGFDVEQFMIDYYILSYETELDTEGNYWLIFKCRKNNLGEFGSFEARFYTLRSIFSLPKIFNWLVILLVSLFVSTALVLFLVVLNVRNKTSEEVNEFKEELHNLLKSDEK